MNDDASSSDGPGHTGDDRSWQRRLRQFSGRTSCGPGELDYDSWQFQVEQLISLSGFSEAVQRRLILQSLVQPALGLVRSLGGAPSMRQILGVTEVVYGPAADGHTLLLKCHDTLQGSDESASEYLQRLQRLLRRVVDSGESTRQAEYGDLLRQFCRGTYDDMIVTNLCLESAPERYDDFCELLAAIHGDECRRYDKDVRLGRAVASSSKPKVKAVAHSGTCERGGSHHKGTQRSQTNKDVPLEKVIADALAQQTETIVNCIREMNLNKGSSGHVGETMQAEPRPEVRAPVQQPKRTYFCYRCGLDGHMRKWCNNAANPQLVEQRMQLTGQGADGHRGNWTPLGPSGMPR